MCSPEMSCTTVCRPLQYQLGAACELTGPRCSSRPNRTRQGPGGVYRATLRSNVMAGTNSGRQLESIFLDDVAHPDPITLERLSRRSWMQRLLERSTFFVRRLL